MSADNYFIIKLDANSKFVPVMGFDSDDSEPAIRDRDPRFDTLIEACDWADLRYSEYGVRISRAAREAAFGVTS